MLSAQLARPNFEPVPPKSSAQICGPPKTAKKHVFSRYSGSAQIPLSQKACVFLMFFFPPKFVGPKSMCFTMFCAPPKFVPDSRPNFEAVPPKSPAQICGPKKVTKKHEFSRYSGSAQIPNSQKACVFLMMFFPPNFWGPKSMCFYDILCPAKIFSTSRRARFDDWPDFGRQFGHTPGKILAGHLGPAFHEQLWAALSISEQLRAALNSSEQL